MRQITGGALLLLVLALILAVMGCGGAAVAPGTTQTFAYVNEPGTFLNSNPETPVPAQIAGFSVDSQTGGLTPLSNSPFGAPTMPASHSNPSFVATPDGHLLYLGACTDLLATGSADCTVAEFVVGADGRLSHRATQAVAGTDDMQIAGRFLYSFDSQILRSQVLGFQIGSDGRLTALPPVAPPVPGVIARLAVTPSRKFLYAVIYVQAAPCTVTGAACENVLLMAYSINENTGALTPVDGSPFASPLKVGQNAPGGFTAIVIDGQSRFVYLAGELTQNVIGFAIGPNGALSALPGPLANIQTTTGAASPDGKFLFLGVGIISPVGGPGIAAFSIGSSGRLTPVPGSPLLISSLALATGGPVTVDPTGRFLYFLGAPFKAGAAIWKTGIGADGTLSHQAQMFNLPGFTGTSVLMVTRTP